MQMGDLASVGSKSPTDIFMCLKFVVVVMLLFFVVMLF